MENAPSSGPSKEGPTAGTCEGEKLNIFLRLPTMPGSRVEKRVPPSAAERDTVAHAGRTP